MRLQAAPGAERVSLPSPDLLDCHYRVVEILNASGMGEAINQKIIEWEDMKNSGGAGSLKADGTSDLEKLLSMGLWGFAPGWFWWL